MLVPLVRPPDCDLFSFRFDLALPAVEAAVPFVRRLLRSALEAIGLDADVPCLLVTELLTNALRHGDGAPSVILDLAEGWLFIVVSDASTVHPAVRAPAPTQECGRGLSLVEELADEWGVESIGQVGKAVWAQVAAA